MSLAWFAIAALATLLLVGVSVFVWRPAADDGGPRPATRFFLVLLRLAIGWHFCIEGLEKLHSPTWSSEGYLRESTGPLAPYFRELAGDRLVEQLTVSADGDFPPALALEWQAYLDAFGKFYDLDADQRAKAEAVVEQAKKDAIPWLTVRKRLVEMPALASPAILAARTIPERIAILHGMETELRELEASAPNQGSEENLQAWKASKTNMSRWRAALQRDLRIITKDMKRGLQDFLLKSAEGKLTDQDRKKISAVRESVAKDEKKEKVNHEDWDDEDRLKDKRMERVLVAFREVVNARRARDAAADATWDGQMQLILVHVIDRKSRGQDPYEPLPVAVSRPMSAWSILDWSDRIVKYGLTAVGMCLLLGLFTRTACIAGAIYLLLFFLAMPPFPGWPDSPRSEGHYLFINKNIIEMLALCALATTRSGRWAGVDALFQLFRPAKTKAAP